MRLIVCNCPQSQVSISFSVYVASFCNYRAPYALYLSWSHMVLGQLKPGTLLVGSPEMGSIFYITVFPNNFPRALQFLRCEYILWTRSGGLDFNHLLGALFVPLYSERSVLLLFFCNEVLITEKKKKRSGRSHHTFSRCIPIRVMFRISFMYKTWP